MRFLRWSLAFFTFALMPGVVAAQPAGSVLAGQVMDASGAAVVGAEVTLESAGGAAPRHQRTDGAGRYRFDLVPGGEHELRVSKPGFASFVERLTTDGRHARTEDVTLQLATLAESVTVTFTEARSQSALKYEAPIRDQPRAVTSYTAGFMRNIEARRIEDLFPYITGMTRAGDTAYDFTVRGVRSREPNNILVDGLPGLPVRFGSPSLSNVERIEVLRGPASTTYGQVQPGGMINIVSKRPGPERRNLFDVRLGSVASDQRGVFTSGQFDGDFSGRIDSESRLLYRFVFSYIHNASFRSAVDAKSVLVAPMVTWAPNAWTSLEVGLEYRRDRVGYDDGLVAPAADITRVASPETRYQEPGDFVRDDGVAATVRVTRVLGPKATWTSSWRAVFHNDYRQGYENFQVARDLRTLQRRDREQETDRRYNYAESNVRTVVATGQVVHTLLAGFMGGYELRAPNQIVLTRVPALDINLYAPAYGAARPRPVEGPYRRNTFLNGGVYVQDHVTLSPAWKVLVAIRGDAQRAEYEDRRSTAGRTTHPAAWSPTAGVVFTPGARWSLYSNVSTSFAPANPEAEDINGENNFSPERGREIEAGVRTSWGPIESSAAVYKITREDVLKMVGGGITTQSGEEQSRGFEWELRASAGGLQTIVGYAYTDAEVTKDDEAVNVGALVTNVPRHSVNVWGWYEFLDGSARGLGAGLGIVSRSDRAGSAPSIATPALRLPGFVRADARVAYRRGRNNIMLHVTNLTNRRYYDSALSALSIQPGAPRQTVLSWRVNF